MPPKKKRAEHDDSGLQQKCSRQDCLLSAQTLASNFEDGASDSEANALDTQSDQDFQEHRHNERDFTSDEEDDFHGIRSCLTFQDRYENHEDHDQRPFWVCLMFRKEFDGKPNKRGEKETHIFFEYYKIQSKEKASEAENFILSIAEPVNRPSFVHEYKLTSTSLYAAVTMGKTTEDIIRELTRQSKNFLPSETIDFIEKHTRNIGKLELVDSGSDNFSLIVYDEHIAGTMCGSGDLSSRLCDLGLRKIDSDETKGVETSSEAWKTEFHEDGIMRPNQGTLTRFAFDQPQNCTLICKVLLDATYSVINLYDFKNDTSVKKVEMKPRNEASLRPYQDECLSKIFSNGRARSGIIVLPCGAGKTLVGVSVASLIQRDTVVLCSGAVAVRQWAEQFQMWTTVEKECVVEFTSHSQGLEKLFRMRSGLIVITTYSMIRRGLVSGKQEANPGAVRILGHNWGLLIPDEVHMAPADVTWTCMSMTKVKCKVGLTATLVREDAKVSSLDILVGPKLYEAKWMALADKGYIARVRCLEVSCLMTSEFIRQYLQTSDFRRKANLWTLNPNKFLACLHLLKLHKERQEKVIIFIDDLVCFYSYVDLLETQHFLHGCSITSMHGDTPQKERDEIMKSYKANQGFAVILLTKVGDVAIDLPDASVVIQVSWLYGSRMQETQRLGRILRAKANCQGTFNASFYTLVSKDTSDMHFAFKRQAYLVAQGYSYTAVCFPSSQEEKMWCDDAGIGTFLAQKVENYKNEKKEYKEKFKRQKDEKKLKKYDDGCNKHQNKFLNFLSRKLGVEESPIIAWCDGHATETGSAVIGFCASCE